MVTYTIIKLATGEEVATFASLTEAREVCAVLNGTVGGYGIVQD